jgi:hypothetical protein
MCDLGVFWDQKVVPDPSFLPRDDFFPGKVFQQFGLDLAAAVQSSGAVYLDIVLV